MSTFRPGFDSAYFNEQFGQPQHEMTRKFLGQILSSHQHHAPA